MDSPAVVRDITRWSSEPLVERYGEAWIHDESCVNRSDWLQLRACRRWRHGSGDPDRPISMRRGMERPGRNRGEPVMDFNSPECRLMHSLAKMGLPDLIDENLLPLPACGRGAALCAEFAELTRRELSGSAIVIKCDPRWRAEVSVQAGLNTMVFSTKIAANWCSSKWGGGNTALPCVRSCLFCATDLTESPILFEA